ncbi:hypothetical protein [Paraburkholderia graminis]|uniref:hypothetical protein n=1 Tax=Paraburkholderia graminis TaxID=60548 RepID=UPI0038B8CA85
MTQVTQSQTESTTVPASQPPVVKLPADDSCELLSIERTAPVLCTRPQCAPRCCCPSVATGKPLCLDNLIRDEAAVINKGEQAKKFKADLEALLGKLKGATLDYTADSYKDLKTRWKTEDEAIVCLIRSVQCALPCWWCVIECEICPLVNEIHGLELELSGEYLLPNETAPAPAAATTTAAGTTATCFKSIYDQRYWWWREKIRRQALFDHVANVMKSWEAPVKTIDGILKANSEIIKTITSALNIDQKKEIGKYLFELVRLVRQHMAIAPPASVVPTSIEKRYVELCCWDQSPELHSCCGVVIRRPTVLDRVIGALPYLIDPALYPDLVCCLATKVYQPAKRSAVDADSQYADLDSQVKAIEAAIPAQIGSLPADAKIRLAKTIECANYTPKPGGEDGKQKCCGDATPASSGEPAKETTDPAQTPCAPTPPVQTPPAQTPCTQTPHVQTPPAQTPCAQTPLVQTPPAQTPCVQTPPVQTPPAQTPCAQTPPVQTPPEQTPCAQTPPEQTPPAQTPCAQTPPVQPSPQAPNVAQTEPAPQAPGPAQSV